MMNIKLKAILNKQLNNSTLMQYQQYIDEIRLIQCELDKSPVDFLKIVMNYKDITQIFVYDDAQRKQQFDGQSIQIFQFLTSHSFDPNENIDINLSINNYLSIFNEHFNQGIVDCLQNLLATKQNSLEYSPLLIQKISLLKKIKVMKLLFSFYSYIKCGNQVLNTLQHNIQSSIEIINNVKYEKLFQKLVRKIGKQNKIMLTDKIETDILKICAQKQRDKKQIINWEFKEFEIQVSDTNTLSCKALVSYKQFLMNIHPNTVECGNIMRFEENIQTYIGLFSKLECFKLLNLYQLNIEQQESQQFKLELEEQLKIRKGKNKNQFKEELKSFIQTHFQNTVYYNCIDILELDYLIALICDGILHENDNIKKNEVQESNKLISQNGLQVLQEAFVEKDEQQPEYIKYHDNDQRLSIISENERNSMSTGNMSRASSKIRTNSTGKQSLFNSLKKIQIDDENDIVESESELLVLDVEASYILQQDDAVLDMLNMTIQLVESIRKFIFLANKQLQKLNGIQYDVFTAQYSVYQMQNLFNVIKQVNLKCIMDQLEKKIILTQYDDQLLNQLIQSFTEYEQNMISNYYNFDRLSTQQILNLKMHQNSQSLTPFQQTIKVLIIAIQNNKHYREQYTEIRSHLEESQ